MTKLKLRWLVRSRSSYWDGPDLHVGSPRVGGSGGMVAQLLRNGRWGWRAFAWHKGEEFEGRSVTNAVTAQRQVERWLTKKRSA